MLPLAVVEVLSTGEITTVVRLADEHAACLQLSKALMTSSPFEMSG